MNRSDGDASYLVTCGDVDGAATGTLSALAGVRSTRLPAPAVEGSSRIG